MFWVIAQTSSPFVGRDLVQKDPVALSSFSTDSFQADITQALQSLPSPEQPRALHKIFSPRSSSRKLERAAASVARICFRPTNDTLPSLSRRCHECYPKRQMTQFQMPEYMFCLTCNAYAGR